MTDMLTELIQTTQPSFDEAAKIESQRQQKLTEAYAHWETCIDTSATYFETNITKPVLQSPHTQVTLTNQETYSQPCISDALRDQLAEPYDIWLTTHATGSAQMHHGIDQIESLLTNEKEKKRLQALFGDAEHDIALITQFMGLQFDDLPADFREKLPNTLQDSLIQWAPQVLRLMKKQLRGEVNPTDVQLGPELQYIRQFFTEYCSHDPQILVKLTIEGEAQVHLDPDYMRAAIWNIVRNSHKVLQRGTSGTISMSQTLEDNHVVITIEDDGPGFPTDLIDEEHMVTIHNEDGTERKIQKAYARGETQGTGGSGFGLDIARKAIEQAKGSVVSENRPEGGAKTVIRLPVKKS